MTAIEPPPVWRRAARALCFAVVFWTLVAVLFTLPRLATGLPWWPTLLDALAQWWAWALLTPLIMLADHLLPLSHQQLLLRLAVHLALGLLVTLLYVLLYALLQALLGSTARAPRTLVAVLGDAMGGLYPWAFLVYCMIVSARHAYLYHRRYLADQLRFERLERSFAEARLQALRMQLDPHFLFNALNTISAHVSIDARLTRSMIEHLAELLRMSLALNGKSEIALADELAFLEHYLAIQRIRFGDSLDVQLDIDAAVLRAAVPNLFLQPLVENAIRHGIGPRAGGGRLVIGAHARGGCLHVEVVDDGVGLPPAWSAEASSGLGLSITRARVLGLHGDGGALRVSERAGGGTRVALHWPLRLLEQEQ
ncbi:sensor histidine kinase [Massilia sp. PWRC2]|uniref:sensor histidine kinase n=1 Tax=Massilia sp. PWRC2 TaxID=2804626 RepID=UPI003CEC8C6D